MEKTTSELVEEAVRAIGRGELSLAHAAEQYGPVWAEMQGQVEIALELTSAGQAFNTNLPPLDLKASWARLQSQLTPGLLTSAADSQFEPGLPDLVEPEPVLALPEMPVKTDVKARTTRPPVQLWSRRRKALTWAAALVLIFLTLFAGVAGTAQASEPGDGLYGFKLWLDGSEQLLAFSAGDKANAALRFAERRLGEMERLVQKGQPQFLRQVIPSYNRSVSGATRLVNNRLNLTQRSTLEKQYLRLMGLKSGLADFARRQNNPVQAQQPEQELDEVIKEVEAAQTGQPLTTVPTPTPDASPTTVLTATPLATATLPPTASPSLSPVPTATALPTTGPETTPNLPTQPVVLPDPTEQPVLTTPPLPVPATNGAGGGGGTGLIPPTPAPPVPVPPKIVPTSPPRPQPTLAPAPTAKPKEPEPTAKPKEPEPNVKPTKTPKVEEPKATKVPDPPKPTAKPKEDDEGGKDKGKGKGKGK